MTQVSRRTMMIGSAALAGTGLPGAALAQDAAPTATIERIDPALDALIAPDAKVEVVTDGFQWCEGPVWVGGPDGYLLASDPPKNIIFQWSPKTGRSVWLTPSGYQGPPSPRFREPGSNGLFLSYKSGRDGLVIADSGGRGISGIDLTTKKKTVLADRFEGKRFNSPNDLCVSPVDGAIYFSDPPYGLAGVQQSPDREMDYTGVFRLGRDGKVTLLGKYGMPNGVGISPDGRKLYHTDSEAGWIVHTLDEHGKSISEKPFIDRAAQGIQSKSGDSLKVDAAGHVWLSEKGISIVSPQGKRLGTIRVTGPAANCEIGADGYLYIAANHHVMRVKVKAKKLVA